MKSKKRIFTRVCLTMCILTACVCFGMGGCDFSTTRTTDIVTDPGNGAIRVTETTKPGGDSTIKVSEVSQGTLDTEVNTGETAEIIVGGIRAALYILRTIADCVSE